ncbi:hypothetical protein Tco_1561726, partial [Tanacetum coccineum]
TEMDEDYDIYHSNAKEAIQLSHAHDPFLVVLEPDVQSSFLLRTIPPSISNEVLAEIEQNSRLSRLVNICYTGNAHVWCKDANNAASRHSMPD